jgi:hypothetical protein
MLSLLAPQVPLVHVGLHVGMKPYIAVVTLVLIACRHGKHRRAADDQTDREHEANRVHDTIQAGQNRHAMSLKSIVMLAREIDDAA